MAVANFVSGHGFSGAVMSVLYSHIGVVLGVIVGQLFPQKLALHPFTSPVAMCLGAIAVGQTGPGYIAERDRYRPELTGPVTEICESTRFEERCYDVDE